MNWQVKRGRVVHIRTQDGFSTLEMMIAMTIVTISISMVTITAFGGQAMLIEGELAGIALVRAQDSLEKMQILARTDFDLVNPTSTDEIVGQTIFHKTIDVHTGSDFNSKLIDSTVTWSGENGRAQHVKLSSLVTNYSSAIGGSTCDSVLSGDWSDPQIVNMVTDFATLSGDGGGTYSITSIDAYHGRLYVTTNNSSVANKPTLFVFDITSPGDPVLLSKIDNDPINNSGLNAIHVAGHYAYAASASSFVKGQLQIFDVSGVFPVVTSLFKIATGTVSGSSSQGKGNTILYRDGYVYLGLNKTVSGPEFNIIDVHDPANPFWVGGHTFNRTVSEISVVGQYAYVVTAVNSTYPQELSVLDISNPTMPVLIGAYDAPNASGDGQSVASVGERIYLGRAKNSNAELFRIDHVASTTTPQFIQVGNGYEVGSSVNRIIVRDYLTFGVTTNGMLQILRTDNPALITAWSTPLLLPSSGVWGGLDCEANYLFVASNAIGAPGTLSVITSAP